MVTSRVPCSIVSMC